MIASNSQSLDLKSSCVIEQREVHNIIYVIYLYNITVKLGA